MPPARSLPVRRTALVRTAVWVAVATGPLALISSCARHDPAVPAQSAPQAQAVDQTKAAPDPAGYAELVLGLWLRSGSGEQSAAAKELHTMAPSLQPPSWSEHVPDVERLAAVRSVRQADGAWTVTVAVQFKESTSNTAGKSDAAKAGGTLRYFALPLVVKDPGTAPGAAQAVVVPTAPMEVAAPAALDEPASPYGTQVPDGSALASTVGEFLSAYLGAEEGAERYLAPGIKLPALAAASYTAVQVDEVRAEGRTDGTVGADGTTVRALVQITASDAGGGQWPLSYALTLKARAGRWEVTALQSGLEDSTGKKTSGTTSASQTGAVRRGGDSTVQASAANASALTTSWGTTR
jgi:hypothetical protein